MGYTSLFFRESDRTQRDVSEIIDAALKSLDFERFDPFSGIPGRTYLQTVRLFIAPAAAGWVRVLAETLDESVLAPVSESASFVYACLDSDKGKIVAWRGGQTLDLKAEFGAVPEKIISVQAPASPKTDWMDALPDNIKAMQSHPKQAAKMIDRLSGSLLAKAGGADQREQAVALLSNAGAEDWSSADGKKILSAFAALGIENGVSPDFATLRDAYSLHARRKRRPQAKLLPGDENTLNAVPNALDYLPVYAGKG